MNIGKVKMREGKMEEGIDGGIRCNTNEMVQMKGCLALMIKFVLHWKLKVLVDHH